MYALRFFFDYGGTCVWAANDAARERFGYPVEVSDLPVPDDLRRDLNQACERFDTSLDWSNPSGPSPWSEGEWNEFQSTTDALLERLRATLGADFEVRDERGGPAAG